DVCSSDLVRARRRSPGPGGGRRRRGRQRLAQCRARGPAHPRRLACDASGARTGRARRRTSLLPDGDGVGRGGPMKGARRQDALKGASRVGRSVDVGLLLALVALGCAGLIVLYSGTGGDMDMVQRHGMRLGIGLALLLLVTQAPLTAMRAVTPWFYVASILLLVLVAFVGEGRGAQSWLNLGVVRFQPSELVKLSLPMMLAWMFHLNAIPPRGKVLAAALLLIALPVLLIAEQPDLGTALLVAVSALCVLFLAGLSWRWIVFAIGAAAAAAPVIWHFLHEYQRNRVRTFM